jgi:hypothetical protein
VSGLRWTEEQLAEFQERQGGARRRGGVCPDALPADPGPEGDLQRRCEDYLREHGYPFIHDRSRRKNAPGEILDLTVALPGGRTVYIELKSKDGRASKDQRKTMQMLRYLGHEVHEVRSYRQFLRVVGG